MGSRSRRNKAVGSGEKEGCRTARVSAALSSASHEETNFRCCIEMMASRTANKPDNCDGMRGRGRGR